MSTWYYGLKSFEQCYVQAAAILHGAPASEVSSRADELFLQLTQEVLSNDPLGNQHRENRDIPTREGTLASSAFGRSGKTLHERTHLFTERISGKERLFWKDVDVYGISDFGLRLLDFLSREYVTKGLHGQHFLQILRGWSGEASPECSWRAARALGIFLWRQNTEELRRQVSQWGGNESASSWRRTAMLLDGAYEIDCLQSQEQKSESTSSPTLFILQDWLRQSQQSPSNANTYRCCAAAQTYGLIGKRRIRVALQGLEQLMQTSEQGEPPKSELFTRALVTTYVSLSCSGHIREVLDHLAQQAERSVASSERLQRLHKREVYRRQRSLALEVILEAFFLIIATSFAGIKEVANCYKEPLQVAPALPDPAGRELLLAGVLNSAEQKWQEAILLLFGASIVDRKHRAAAFSVFVRWAEIGEKLDETSQGRLQTFLVSIGRKIESWIGSGQEHRQYVFHACLTYRYRLEQWKQTKKPIGRLAQKVLQQW